MEMMRNNRGYTLIELVVVMAIFLIIIIATTNAFDRIISSGTQQAKSAAGEIKGVVGLEMLRTDMSHAGYALPWTIPTGLNPLYQEVGSAPEDSGMTSTFNDDPPAAAPRAMAGGKTTSGASYLVLKSALLAIPSVNTSIGRWGLVNFVAGGASYVSTVPDGASNLRSLQDYAIALRTSFAQDGSEDKQLVLSSGGGFSFTVPAPSGPLSQIVLPSDFQPTDASQSYAVYALNNSVTGTAPRVPYNRADYYIDFVARTPPSCSPGTGTLLKSVMDNSSSGSGYITPYPILDCVGDFQVVVTAPDSGGSPAYFPLESVASLSTDNLRRTVTMATAFILTHDGRYDRNFSFPVQPNGDVIFVGPYIGSQSLGSVGRMWTESTMQSTFGPNWRNFRWKVFTVPVELKNLQ